MLCVRGNGKKFLFFGYAVLFFSENKRSAVSSQFHPPSLRHDFSRNPEGLFFNGQQNKLCSDIALGLWVEN